MISKPVAIPAMSPATPVASIIAVEMAAIADPPGTEGA
jgi:hypothetical protein